MSRRRGVTPEELDLWRSAMKDAAPMRAPAPEPPPSAKPLVEVLRPAAAPPPPAAAALMLMGLRRDDSAGGKAAFHAAPPVVQPLSENTPGLDRATARRLMKGDKRPEARIDLHGMTLERAHAALIWFILESRQAGRRCVLMITGKGGDYRARAAAGDDFFAEPSRGTLLREKAPRWLTAPPLSGHVIGVYPAHVRHGGAGAFYVYLRK